MAPEVFMKSNTEGHGRAVDVWSIGCVIIEMASGKVQANSRILSCLQYNNNLFSLTEALARV